MSPATACSIKLHCRQVHEFTVVYYGQFANESIKVDNCTLSLKTGNLVIKNPPNNSHIHIQISSSLLLVVVVNERGNPLPPLRGILFSISNKIYFYASSHKQELTFHGLCNTSCSTKWVHREGPIRRSTASQTGRSSYLEMSQLWWCSH